MTNKPPEFQAEKTSDNPNPNAKIGFVIYYPFQFYVYKNIYKYLASESEFIIDLGVYYPIRQPVELENEIIELLKKNGVSFRILRYEDYSYETYLQSFFGQYQALVSVWVRGCMLIKQTRYIKKINPAYGVGKELIGASPWQSMYDIALVYSERMARLHNFFSHSVIVGNPKFDDWFADTVDESTISLVKSKLSKEKKTVLYLPTHSDLSSIDQLADELKKMTRDYNVIVKLHYYTKREEPGRAKKLEHPNVVILQDDIDLLPLLKIADVVVSDNSSAIFDAILADKPVVVSDFWEEAFLDIEHRERKFYRRGSSGALTYSGSIEQVIKREGQVLTLRSPQELRQKLREALQDSEYFRIKRADLRRELFTYADDHCGQRAADAIHACIDNPKSSERPILFHAIEAYKSLLMKMSDTKERRLNDKIAAYETLFNERIADEPNKIVFSIVLICIGDATQEMELVSLRALVGQKFPSQNYEIIIVNGPSEREIGEMIKKIPQVHSVIPNIRCLPSGDDKVGLEAIGDAIRIAHGEVVCFTESAYIVSSNWLLNFSLAYRKYPEIAGVGGYADKHPDVATIFDEYYYSELAEKLGVDKTYKYLNELYEVKNNLLYQNPAGSLFNMSYRKEVLEILSVDYQQISFLKLGEMMIKKEVLKNRFQLCFIPSCVTGFVKMPFREFLKQNFEEGWSTYLVSSTNENLKKYYPFKISSVVLLPLKNIFNGYQKIRLTLVIFIGTLFRWFGKAYATFLMIRDQNR